MRRPRVKPEHAPHRLDATTIRIGGTVYGLAAEISDPYGWAWSALTLMDGTRSPAEIASSLRTRHPGLDEATALGIVDGLLESGYVEDAQEPPTPYLTERERDRYARNRDFFRCADLRPGAHSWDFQLRLKRARVTVIGLGGSGTHAAWSLAAAGVGRLHCVDPDTVELSNLNRQILYTEADIGLPKAEAALRRLTAANSDITITTDRTRISTPADLRSLLHNPACDVLVLCADEPRGPDGLRAWTDRLCMAAGIPWVGGGYSGPLVSVCVIGPGGACLECLQAGMRAQQPVPVPVELGWPGVLPTTAALSGQLIAHAVISLITGLPWGRPGYVRGLNAVAPDHHVHTRHPPRPGCPNCDPDGRSREVDRVFGGNGG
ncbi:MAG: ThiF family adenylyltransferase [Nonomuraea sp.]|nr:ThiF family adenylyltransferase [Nonomuraea sp.]